MKKHKDHRPKIMPHDHCPFCGNDFPIPMGGSENLVVGKRVSKKRYECPDCHLQWEAIVKPKSEA